MWPHAGRMRSARIGKQRQSYWGHPCVSAGHKEPSSQNPEKEQRILAGIRRPSHGWDSAPVNSSPLTPLIDWMPGFPLVSEALTGVKRGSLSLERCTGWMPLLYQHLIHSSSLLGSSSLGSDLPSGK